MSAVNPMPPTFLAGLVVAGRRCVVLGDDAEAAEKSARLHDAGARVELVAERLPPALRGLQARGEPAFRWVARAAVPADCDGAFLVVDCRRDPAAAEELYARAIAPGGFLLCAVDQPAFCTFTNVATIRRGPVQIAVATDGRAPMLAARIRAALDAQLGADLGDFAERFAALRERTPADQRRGILTAAMNGFALAVTYALPDAPGRRSDATAESARALPSKTPRSRPVHKRRGSR